MTNARRIQALHAVLLGCALAGVALGVAGTINDDDPPSVIVRFERFFSYFTILSNILIVAICAVLVKRPLLDSSLWQVVRLISLMSIVITGLIYLIVLRPDARLEGGVEVIGNALRHYIVPPLAVLGWALFGPWPRQEWRDLGRSMLWPLVFTIYTLVHGELSNWYPYDFVDVNESGYGPVIVQTCVTAAEMALIAAALLALNRRWSRTRTASGPPAPVPAQE